MGEKVRCEICDRNFKDSEGLAQHNAAKHFSEKKVGSKLDTKKFRNWIIFIFVIGVIAALGWWMFSIAGENSALCENAPASEINIGGHTNLAMHIHPFLEIIINDEKQLIPANAGISPGIMRPIHTHDASGELHVEGPCRRDFTLGEFFDIWGRDFSSECIFEFCTANGAGVLNVKVNGLEDNEFGDIVLRDDDRIVIEYSSSENV